MIGHSPLEIELNARYARERVAQQVAAARLASTPGSSGTSRRSPASARLRRVVGHGLIAAGSRLAGPAATRSAPTVRPVA